MRQRKGKSRSIAIGLMAALIAATSVLPAAAAPAAEKRYIITSPYEAVDWEAYDQYKADFHAHSTNSDGSNLTSDMIEDHYAKGYDSLAMTDHNYLTSSWDSVEKGPMATERVEEIAAGVGRNGRGMIQLHGTDEQSITDHINSFFVDFNNTSGATMAGTIQSVEELGGITHINHPGRYTGGSAGGSAGAAASNDPATVKMYVDLFMAYPSCVGMEVVNKIDNESRSDRILWDNILMETMPEGRFVWGFSNDDTHSLNATGYSWNEMLLTELNEENVRAAMENGAFYAVSRVDRREGINDTLPDGSTMPGSGNASTLYLLDQSTPSITNITVDHSNSSITITGADYDEIEWIADGKVIASGESLEINDYEGQIGSYVRAHLKSDTGIAYTQPFGIQEVQAQLLDLTTDAHLVEQGDYFHVNAAFLEEISSNAAILNYTYDSAKFAYRGFTEGAGMTLLDTVTGDGTVKMVVMISDYRATDLGEVMFSANEDAELKNEDNSILLSVEYVLRDSNNDKTIETATASVSFTTSGGEDDEYTLIDLSNIIDLFGADTSDEKWEEYKYFDRNNNGIIDIYDISYVAQRIGK